MKKKGLLWGLACTVLMTSCGIMPAEEQLPSAPISKEVQEIEHVMTIVQRGDLEIVDKLRCTYKSAKSEKLAFEVGGEYIATFYVETGDSVKAGELIAELDMGDLNEQLESQQYALETLQMNKRHIEQQQSLALRRCNLQIQFVKEQLAELETAGKTAASASVEEPDESTSVMIPEESSSETESQPESTVPEDSSSAPESSESQDSNVSEEEEETSDSENEKPEEEKPEEEKPKEEKPKEEKPEEEKPEEEKPEEEKPEEPQVDVEALRTQLNQTLKSYNQNLTKVQNQYAQQLSSVKDSIYIQEKKIEELKESIKSRQIYAGIDGSVTFVREYEEGAVSVEDEVVFMIADIDSSVFFISGEEAALLEVGQELMIEYDKEEHEARVIEPKELGLPEKEDGEIVRYIQLVNPDPSLDEGTNGSISIVLESRQDVLYVKSSVIKNMDGKSIVYYLDETGLKSMKEVETGLDNGDYVEIISGLTENEEIIDE